MLQKKALEAAILGLDYFVREQKNDKDSADFGRYPYIADCVNGRVDSLTTNWITGVVVSVMLSGYKVTGDARYLESAGKAVSYIRSLQDFSPWRPRVYGVLHESTPQTPMAHPRDALTGAWAMLDYATLTGDDDARQAAIAYGDWFVKYAMEPGYPYWTVNFNHSDWQPKWFGSFHSGSAFFFYRLAQETGKPQYVETMQQILDFYNRHLLAADGSITVIREHGTFKDIDASADPAWAPSGWIAMHKYNDDFGALANLAAWQYTGETGYRDAALRFLGCMLRQQRPDGGFGPADWQDAIPAAGGVVMQEMITARRLGALTDPAFDRSIEAAAGYVLDQQYLTPGGRFHGAFHGMTGDYVVDRNFCNTRATGYAVMALLTLASEETYAYKVARQR